LKKYLSFVKFEHILFALPLVFAGAFLAAHGLPGTRLIFLILVAAAGARTCALALNRLIDVEVDRRNPRTAARELPSGIMTLTEGKGVALAGAAVYVTAAGLISKLCLVLSPIPLLAFVLYPYLKRFTALAHLGVGVADAMGPLGAWVAVRSAGGAPIFEDAGALWLLTGFTILWIAGFDVIYATLDETFDREAGLHSLPAKLGRADALQVSGALHFLAATCLGFLYVSEFAGPGPLFLLVAIVALLLAEHERVEDVHFAFFTANAGVSFLVLAFISAGVLLPEPV